MVVRQLREEVEERELRILELSVSKLKEEFPGLFDGETVTDGNALIHFITEALDDQGFLTNRRNVVK